MEKIQNTHLEASFSTLGAELQSLRDLATQKEILWQGDPQYWNGRSPILFPITGGLWNGISYINGKTYKIPKHGFAKRREWTIIAHSSDSITFELLPQEGDADIYPYDYALRITYTLQGTRLEAKMSVENRSVAPMYFQIGGHPGIALPFFAEDNVPDGYLLLEGNASHLLRAGTQGCIEVTDDAPTHFPLPPMEGELIPLQVSTFENEALILEEQIESVVVLDRHKEPICRVRSSAPVWLFWSMQGLHNPYVCCEPWYGLPDFQGFEGDIADRPYIQCAKQGKTWEGFYSIDII